MNRESLIEKLETKQGANNAMCLELRNKATREASQVMI